MRGGGGAGELTKLMFVQEFFPTHGKFRNLIFEIWWEIFEH